MRASCCLLVLLCSCGSFSFEVHVGPVGNDVEIVVDGASQPTVEIEDVPQVVIVNEFRSYAEGTQSMGFRLAVVRPEQPVYEEVIRPGYCGRSQKAHDWNLERIYLDVSPPDLGLSLIRCDGPSGDVTVVVE
jgi:hypothetical protein